MRTYEVVLIIHPELDEAAFNDAIDKVKGWIVDAGGSVEKIDVWGKREMAYSIRKQREGQYALITAQMATTFTTELERNMRLLEPLLRFMVTKVD